MYGTREGTYASFTDSYGQPNVQFCYHLEERYARYLENFHEEVLKVYNLWPYLVPGADHSCYEVSCPSTFHSQTCEKGSCVNPPKATPPAGVTGTYKDMQSIGVALDFCYDAGGYETCHIAGTETYTLPGLANKPANFVFKPSHF